MTFPVSIAGFYKQADGCNYPGGLYTKSEVDDLVNIDGYIPVSTSTEIAKIDTGVLETMGVGSCWEGDYTTGSSEKYIQVLDIDFTDDQISGVGVDITGVYDGNELALDNRITLVSSLFPNQSGTVKNIRMSNADMTTTGSNNPRGILIGQTTGGTIENCIVNGDISNNGITGGIIGKTGTLTSALVISDCHFSGTAESVNNATNNNGVGGVIGAANTGTVTFNVDMDNCTNSGDITGARDYVGGLSGWAIFTNVTECYNTGTISGRQYAGGCFGLLFEACVAVDSYNLGVVDGANSAGFAGWIRLATTIDNCFAANTGTSTQGLVFTVSDTSTATNSYWDTTIGAATSAAGTGQTTVALQTPTTNSGIYSAWTIPPWNFGTATDYPVLTTTP